MQTNGDVASRIRQGLSAKLHMTHRVLRQEVDIGEATRATWQRQLIRVACGGWLRRRQSYDLSGWSFTDPGDGDLGLLVTIAVLVGAWLPFWFVAHWFGLRRRIVITRSGEEMDEEYVRG